MKKKKKKKKKKEEEEEEKRETYFETVVELNQGRLLRHQNSVGEPIISHLLSSACFTQLPASESQ